VTVRDLYLRRWREFKKRVRSCVALGPVRERVLGWLKQAWAWILPELRGFRAEALRALDFQSRTQYLVGGLTIGFAAYFAFLLRERVDGTPLESWLPLSRVFVILVACPVGVVIQALICRGTENRLLRLGGVAVSLVALVAAASFVARVTHLRERTLRAEVRARCHPEPDALCGVLREEFPEIADEAYDEAQLARSSTGILPRDFDGRVIRRFESLSAKNQAFVKDQYAGLLAAFEKRDFAAMNERTRNILALVDDYNDTVSYQAIATRGLQEREQAHREEERREKEQRLRAELAELEKQLGPAVENALADPRLRPPVTAQLSDMLLKDPSNKFAGDSLSRIREADAAVLAAKNRVQVAALVKEGKKIYPRTKKDTAARGELRRVISSIRALDRRNGQATEWDNEIFVREAAERLEAQVAEKRRENLERAKLEIRGERLLPRARSDAAARAELYEVMDRIRARFPASTFPSDWERRLHGDPKAKPAVPSSDLETAAPPARS
jgi:hypothetical protein